MTEPVRSYPQRIKAGDDDPGTDHALFLMTFHGEESEPHFVRYHLADERPTYAYDETTDEWVAVNVTIVKGNEAP